MTSLCNSPVNLKILWPSDVINPFPKIWGLLKWFWIMLCVASPAKSVLDTHGWFSIFLVGENHQLRGVWELDCRDLVILLSTRNGTTGLSSLQLLVFSREFLITKVAERNANLWNFHPLKGTRCVGQPHMAPGFSGISWVPTVVGRKQIDSKQHGCLSQVSPPEKRLAPQEASFSDGFDMFSMFLLVGGGVVYFGDGYKYRFFVPGWVSVFWEFLFEDVDVVPRWGWMRWRFFLFLVGIRMDTLFFPEWLWKDFKRFVSLWESWRSPFK